jgi:hypothetical protein
LDEPNPLDAFLSAQFADSLIGYLAIRQWAFEKIGAASTDSDLMDLRVHHYLYFTNLFGAIDLILDSLASKEEQVHFNADLSSGFGNESGFLYARELRNALVHRGLDPITETITVDNRLFAFCPQIVFGQGGKKAYARPCPLIYTLATFCNGAANDAIFSVAERKGLLDSTTYQFNMRSTDDFEIPDDTEFCPDDIDYESFKLQANEASSDDLCQSRIRRLNTLLGRDEA